MFPDVGFFYLRSNVPKNWFAYVIRTPFFSSDRLDRLVCLSDINTQSSTFLFTVNEFEKTHKYSDSLWKLISGQHYSKTRFTTCTRNVAFVD